MKTEGMHPTTQTVLLAFIITLAGCASVSNECPANQKISCERQLLSRGYTYTVPVPPDTLCAGNCDHGWYYQNGTFIVDSTPNGNGNRLPVVVDVTPHNLILSVCESLQWQLDCGKCKCFIDYTVTDLKLSGAPDPLLVNNTHVEEQDANHKGNDLPAWSIVLIGIAVCAIITIILAGIWVKFVKEPKPTDVL